MLAKSQYVKDWRDTMAAIEDFDREYFFYWMSVPWRNYEPVD